MLVPYFHGKGFLGSFSVRLSKDFALPGKTLQRQTSTFVTEAAQILIESNSVDNAECCVPSKADDLQEQRPRSASPLRDPAHDRVTDIVSRLDGQSVVEEFSTYINLLRECGNAKALSEGRRVHGLIIRKELERDRFVGNLLVDLYGKCGAVEDARSTFDDISQRNLYSWNIMIAACTQHSHAEEAVEHFKRMQEEGLIGDKFTFSSILGACASLAALSEGREIHANIVDEGLESDVFTTTALVNMYGKCGSLQDARDLFDRVQCRDAVTWNAMITGYAQHGQETKALQLYQRMQQEGVKPERVTFISVLAACSGVPFLAQGKIIHSSIINRGFELDVVIATALVNMYSKCGSLQNAQVVFDEMVDHDVVSWSAMIAAYALNGKDKDALRFFLQLQKEGMKPDTVTFVTVFGACANLGVLEDGGVLHASVVKRGAGADVTVGNALVNMYGKCGCLMDSQWVFDNMRVRNVISWTAMIEGLAYAGHAKEAIHLLVQMQEEGVEPNDVTFVNVLSACSHAGLVDEACHQFNSMSQSHDIRPSMEHYGCMIDLFERAGLLDEAKNVICKLPFKANFVIWETLLGACRVHGDVEIGKHAAEHGIALDSQNYTPYVLLSNIYSAEGRWDDAATIRKLMIDRGGEKQPGYRSIEVQNRVHDGFVGDQSCPPPKEKYVERERLRMQMDASGYA